MDPIDVVVLVSIVAILSFMYAAIVALNVLLDEIREVGVRVGGVTSEVDARDDLLFEVVKDLDSAIRENTTAMTAHIEDMETMRVESGDSLEAYSVDTGAFL